MVVLNLSMQDWTYSRSSELIQELKIRIPYGKTFHSSTNMLNVKSVAVVGPLMGGIKKNGRVTPIARP